MKPFKAIILPNKTSTRPHFQRIGFRCWEHLCTKVNSMSTTIQNGQRNSKRCFDVHTFPNMIEVF